jgi:hypothetical protein
VDNQVLVSKEVPERTDGGLVDWLLGDMTLFHVHQSMVAWWAIGQLICSLACFRHGRVDPPWSAFALVQGAPSKKHFS